MFIEMKQEHTAMISNTQGETEDIQNCDTSKDRVYKNLGNPENDNIKMLATFSDVIDLDSSDNNIVTIATQNTTELYAPIDESEFDDEDDDGHSELLAQIEENRRKGAYIPTGLSVLYKLQTGVILAKRVIGSGNKSHVVLVCAYNDGNISDEIKIENAEIGYVVCGNYGKKSDSYDQGDISLAKRTIKKLADRIMPYWRAGMEMPIWALVELIKREYYHIKEERTLEPTIDDIYAFIVHTAETRRDRHDWEFTVAKDSYRFEEYQIEEFATHFGYKKLEFLELLKRHKYLVLPPSSKGYQRKIKDDGYRYCIKMMSSHVGKVTPVKLVSNPYDRL